MAGAIVNVHNTASSESCLFMMIDPLQLLPPAKAAVPPRARPSGIALNYGQTCLETRTVIDRHRMKRRDVAAESCRLPEEEKSASRRIWCHFARPSRDAVSCRERDGGGSPFAPRGRGAPCDPQDRSSWRPRAIGKITRYPGGECRYRAPTKDKIDAVGAKYSGRSRISFNEYISNNSAIGPTATDLSLILS